MAVRVPSMIAGLDTSTVTPGSTAPVVSRATPEMAVWACAAATMFGTAKNPTVTRSSVRNNATVHTLTPGTTRP